MSEPSPPKTLSIIITSLNEDFDEINATIASIRATAGDIEIVLVDDASLIPVLLDDKSVRLIRNPFRAGVAASRHIAAHAATGDFLLIIDAHMRFEAGWLERALQRISNRPYTMHCATCVGLWGPDEKFEQAHAEYNGATIMFHGRGPKDMADQIVEGKWLDPRDGDDYQIPCVMGACYFIARDFFFHVGGLKLLRQWGSDETFLSLKVWLAGGEIRIMKSVRIAHKFREASPYKSEVAALHYNHMAVVQVVIPEPYRSGLLAKFGATRQEIDARSMIAYNANEILAERAHFDTIRSLDFETFLGVFGLHCPK